MDSSKDPPTSQLLPQREKGLEVSLRLGESLHYLKEHRNESLNMKRAPRGPKWVGAGHGVQWLCLTRGGIFLELDLGIGVQGLVKEVRGEGRAPV